MEKSIEKKFKEMNEFTMGSTQLVTEYSQFKHLSKKNHSLAILMDGGDFDAYLFECKEETGKQRIFLQQKYYIIDGPIKEKGNKVVEYIIPLEGKLNLQDFKCGKVKEYFFT